MWILHIPWRFQCIGLLAAARAQGFAFGPRYYVGLAILIVLMTVALMKAFRMWEEIHDVEPPDSPVDRLEALEAAHAAGELNDDEFERVRRCLMGAGPGPDELSGANDRGADMADHS